MKKKHIVPLMIALLLVIAGAVFFLCGTAKKDTFRASDSIVRTVRFANRTITAVYGEGSVPTKEGSVPSIPAMPAHLSRRGTASFIVLAREEATRPVRDRIAAHGARVTGIVAPYGIVVEAGAEAAMRIASDPSFLAVEGLSPDDKMARSLKRAIAQRKGIVPVTVVPLSGDDSPEIGKVLEANGAKVIWTCGSDAGVISAEMPVQLVAELARRGDVRWLERFVRPEFLTDVAVKPGLLNVSPVHETHGLAGRGQYVTITDSGLDTGNPANMSDDFKGRIGFITTFLGCLDHDKEGHGTHVAGILAGNGSNSGGRFKGVAYEAGINVFQCALAGGGVALYPPENILKVDSRYPSYIHSASWGMYAGSEYDSYCVSVDSYLWSHPEILMVVASGNTNTRETVSHAVFSPAGAKNVVAVGATENYRLDKGRDSDNPSQTAYFSAHGPMHDGRIKPDVCAPGTFVISAKSSKSSNGWWGQPSGYDRYLYNSGTSMSTPFVSGCAALIRQWLIEQRGCTQSLPSAALLKSILTGGAYDMSVDAGADCGGAAPNSWQGWGRVDLGQSLYPTNATVLLADRIAYSKGSSYSIRVAVTNSSPFVAQLAWIDYPGALGAGRDIVNDLDLVVSNETTGAVWYGNGVNGGDRVNTVESVRLSAGETGPGVYSVTVKGITVIADSDEGGAAALYVRGAFPDSVDDRWHGEPDAEMKLRTCIVLSSVGGKIVQSVESKVAKGGIVHFSVPQSIPGGSELIDMSTPRDYYEDEDGSAKIVTVQRLGRIEVAAFGAGFGEPATNSAGHMATEFSVTMDGDKDVLFKFYDESSVNMATTLPMWWYRRYVEGDPLADVVRFTAVSPSCLELTGGAGLTRVLERTECLGAQADWKAVHTFHPAPVLTNAWPVPSEYSTNSFFRIR